MSAFLTGSQCYHKVLRKVIIDYMILYAQEFGAYSDRDIVEYIIDSKMTEDGKYMTDEELRAFSTLLNTKVVSYSPVPAMNDTFHWIFISPSDQIAKDLQPTPSALYIDNREIHWEPVLSVHNTNP